MAVRYDIIVVGAGPAGLTAAIYARRAGKSVLVLEKEIFGGQITHSPKVENYPGFKAVSGNEFAELLVDQADALGAELDVDTVTGIENAKPDKIVHGESGKTYLAGAVIIAAGSKPRMLGVPREDELTGNGVSYCVLCDGAFFAGKDVAVVGGGNTALQDAVLLSETCTKVTIVQNLGFLTGEAKLVEILKAKPNVDFIFNTVINGLEGGDELTGLSLLNTENNVQSHLPVSGVFVAIGQVPENEPFAGVCSINKWGYIESGEDCLTETSGIFTAGDCRTKTVRQITTATGDGAVAALAACKYLDSAGR